MYSSNVKFVSNYVNCLLNLTFHLRIKRKSCVYRQTPKNIIDQTKPSTCLVPCLGHDNAPIIFVYTYPMMTVFALK